MACYSSFLGELMTDRRQKKKNGNVNKEMKETVSVDISDLLELAKNIIMDARGGLHYNEIEYLCVTNDGSEKLKFLIPKVDRSGKCNEILSPGGSGDGCGETGGACICGKPENHDGDHECELCGEEW